MENNPELQLAWQFIENTGTHLFLTGKAGTGKTTFLKRLREHTPKRMVVLAPTGIAAINAGGVTIHSFFQLSFAPFVPETTFNSAKMHYRFSKEKRNIIRSMDLLPSVLSMPLFFCRVWKHSLCVWNAMWRMR